MKSRDNSPCNLMQETEHTDALLLKIPQYSVKANLAVISLE